jgi:hypothetical protein
MAAARASIAAGWKGAAWPFSSRVLNSRANLLRRIYDIIGFMKHPISVESSR